MKIELIPEQGNFYKANLHCHTTLSDGQYTPEEIKELYKKQGYSVVCFTDHEVLIPHEELNDDGFIALHGYEMAIKKEPEKSTGYFMPVYHFNFIAEDQGNRIMPRCYLNSSSSYVNGRYWRETLKPYDPNDVMEETKYDVEWINDYLSAVKNAGFLITYNHPQWSLHSVEDYVGLKHLHAIEAMNGGCAAMQDNTSLHFEQMLRRGMNVVPVGGDDTHKPSDCFLAWTMIKAPELTYDALIAAYKRGDCYASEGPEILGLSIEDGEIVVKTSPAARIALRTEGRFTAKIKDENAELTEAHFAYTPEKFGRYLRVEVRDAKGRFAYSRAYFTAQIQEKLQ